MSQERFDDSMVESPEARQIVRAAETKADSGNQSTTAFLEELAKDHARPFRMANSSNDGYSCQIYKTKSDCDWHPPCHWNGASQHCG